MNFDLTFSSQGAYVELEVWEDGKTATVAAFNSTFKRRGAGTRIFDQAVGVAELMGLTLVLQVSPFGDDMGMDKTDLRAFYMSRGFEWKGNDIMERKPKSVEVNHA